MFDTAGFQPADIGFFVDVQVLKTCVSVSEVFVELAAGEGV